MGRSLIIRTIGGILHEYDYDNMERFEEEAQR